LHAQYTHLDTLVTDATGIAHGKHLLKSTKLVGWRQ
jgi:hypothetical protein